jgi:hypothetical protein
MGPGFFCTTKHRRILRALSPSLWRNEGSLCYPIHPTRLIQRRLSFLFPKLKIGTEGARFQAVSSIQQTVTGELKAIREEAFSRAFDSLYERCKRVRKRAGPMLSYTINIYFFIVLCFLCPQSWNFIVTLCRSLRSAWERVYSHPGSMCRHPRPCCHL